MKYERFLKIILTLQMQDKKITSLHKLNIDLIYWGYPYNVIIIEFLKEIYGDTGYDWFSWYCYESEYGTRDWVKNPRDGVEFGARDENKNSICYSHEFLWEYLEANCKTKTK